MAQEYLLNYVLIRYAGFTRNRISLILSRSDDG